MNNFEDKDKDRKEHRRKNLVTKNKDKREYSDDEQKFMKKTKKELKNKISEMREEELWDDWESDL